MTVLDWSKAPEGATHYDPSDDGMNMPWVKLSKERFYCWEDKVGWIGPLKPNDDFFSDGNVDRLIPRSTKPAVPEWDGEGWPPVGCECEVKVEEWETCRVIGFDKPFMCVSREGSGYYAAMQEELRPLRTKEQRERDEVIAQALNVALHPADDEIHPRQYLTDCLDALFDAGLLRKGDS